VLDYVSESVYGLRKYMEGKSYAEYCKEQKSKHAKKRYAMRKAGIANAKEKKCERCGKQAFDAHHEDYSKPLEVNYFCRRCHKLRHKEIGWGFGGEKISRRFAT
jgi:ribosomal protein S27AE